MKNQIFILMMLVASVAKANDRKYYEAVGKHMQVVYTSHSIDELQGATNALDRISAAEKSKWESYYYSAFGYLMMANQEGEAARKDSFLDQALERVRQAAAVSPGNAEISALEGFVHMLRVAIDPASRGQQYSQLSMQAYGRALQQDPNNPRALALMAQMQFGTARFFGSPTTDACGMARKALDQFNAFKSETPIAPRWGKEMTEELLTSCN